MDPWFDTHAHLDRYLPAEQAALLARARRADVEVVAVGIDIASSRAVCALDGVAGRVVGVHPLRAAPGFEAELRELALHQGVVGIGECGFDVGGPDWEDQAATFVAQCKLARDLDRSLVLHIDGEGAWEHLTAHGDALRGLRVIRHYFTGDAAQAEWHAQRGHWLAFGNPLRRDDTLGGIAANYRPDRLLIETDSYPLPGRTTEPGHAPAIGEALARARGWTLDQTRARLAANTRAAFVL